VALAALLLGSCSDGVHGVGNRPVPEHLVLITVDTLRGDHVLTTAAGEPLTPALEVLTSRGVTFSSAHSTSTMTSPGLASILSGLLPHRNAVIRNDHVLAPQVPTLATVLRDIGFATAGVVANPVVRAGFGFEIGFDHYEFVDRIPPLKRARADQVTEAAIAWLEQCPQDRRFFLWVHYMDPHGPYQPPDDVRALFPASAFGEERTVPLLEDSGGFGGIPFYQQYGFKSAPTDPRDYLSRYAAEVRSMDRELGRLLMWLEDADLLDKTVLAFTADHGEALENDQGFYFSHMHSLTQDQVHVPLMLVYPGCQAGSRVDRPVSTVDVLPTVLGLLGVDLPEESDGQALVASEPDLVMGMTSNQRSVRDGRWKLIVDNDGSERLYDLSADPGEGVSCAAGYPEVVARLERVLGMAADRAPLAEPVLRDAVSEEERTALEALGYVQE
jgi:arylsulfatase